MNVDCQFLTHAHPRVRRTLLSLSTVLLAACGADAIVSVPAHTPTAPTPDVPTTTDRVIDVTLFTVIPRTWESPPTISSDVLTFLRVDDVEPFYPGGYNQRFRFKVVGTGQAIVTFRQTWENQLMGVFVDTIQVR